MTSPTPSGEDATPPIVMKRRSHAEQIADRILALLDELSAAKSVIDELVTFAKARGWSSHAPLTAWVIESIDELDALRTRAREAEADVKRMDWIEARRTQIDTPESLDESGLEGFRMETNLYLSWDQPPASLRAHVDAEIAKDAAVAASREATNG